MFGTNHIIWLAICTVFVMGLSLWSIKRRFSFKTAAWIMAGISFFSEMSKIFSDMEFVNGQDAAEGMVIDAGSLPFHLCSLLIFVYFYMPFCKNERAKQFLLGLSVPVGIVGSLLAMLIATSGTDFNDIGSYQCFIYHAGMMWFSLYLVFTKQVDLGAKAWLRNLISLFCLSIIMLWVNGALQAYDTNFLYVVRPPADNLPILNLNNGWYAYFASIVICGFVGLTAVHIPFILREKKKKSG